MISAQCSECQSEEIQKQKNCESGKYRRDTTPIAVSYHNE